MSDEPALLLVGHGTRSAAGAAAFEAFIRRCAARMRGQGVDVGGGFIELAAPPLADAVAGLAGRGHRELVAVPLVLVAASHGKGDVPAALERERGRHPGLGFHYGRPLGPHPTLLSLLEERVDAVLGSTAGACAPGASGSARTGTVPGRESRPPGSGTGRAGGPAGREGTAVVLVGRGSTDPDANAEVAKVARLLWEGRGYAFVEPAFVSLAWPGVPAALERARLLGASRVVVAPYFLFEGVLPERVREQAREYAAAHPGLDLRVAEVLGDCAGLAGLVAERYGEALGGDIRMNCDTCAYRVALPGFGHRVGAPQVPHDHPHDRAHSR